MDSLIGNAAGPSPPARDNRRQQLLLALLLSLVAAALVFRAWMERRGDDEASQATSEYAAFIAAVHQADGIADPLQRCLRYPNLPGSHWSDETTEVYCQLRNRRTLPLAELDVLLKQGNAAAVDSTFAGYLDKQRHDPGQPGILDMAFINASFGDASPATRRVIDEWKRQSPQSAFAFAASGMQYEAAAQLARGNGWAGDLSDGQVMGMHQQLVLAREDLERAAALSPGMVAPYTSMIYIGAMGADDAYAYQAARRGLAVEPANFGLRGKMMAMAQPRWGSLFDGENTQQSEVDALVPRNPLLRMVANTPAAFRATCDCGFSHAAQVRLLAIAADSNSSFSTLAALANEAYNHGLHLQAVELYSESLRFNQENPDVLRWRARQMLLLGDADGAVQSVAQAVQRFPDNTAVATAMGNILAATGHVEQAESTYLAVLKRDPDHQQAMSELGDLYNHAGHQPDKAEALADLLISRHPENPGGYIVRACNQMDHNLPGRYETIHYFIDHFGSQPKFRSQAAEMRAYLLAHPEKMAGG